MRFWVRLHYYFALHWLHTNSHQHQLEGAYSVWKTEAQERTERGGKRDELKREEAKEGNQV